MSNEILVYKARTNVVAVYLGIDVSGDTITSEIRSEPDINSPLIATWDVSFETDGTDGVILLSLDSLTTEQIANNSGYMDLKRSSGGEPYAVFERALEVSFVGSVTA